MYEVFLGSKGIMQLGWATVRCRFTNEVRITLKTDKKLLNLKLFITQTFD